MKKNIIRRLSEFCLCCSSLRDPSSPSSSSEVKRRAMPQLLDGIRCRFGKILFKNIRNSLLIVLPRKDTLALPGMVDSHLLPSAKGRIPSKYLYLYSEKSTIVLKKHVCRKIWKTQRENCRKLMMKIRNLPSMPWLGEEAMPNL